jgi:hypothetical protein
MDDIFPSSNVWLKAKAFLCLWHMRKAWAKNVVKILQKCKTKILYALGQIMYSRACPLDHDLVLWVQLQIDIMATKYPNAF